MEINVLDKGYVKLIDHMGTDLSPIESARMSTDNLTGVDEAKDDKLRDFLWKNQHTSPFESLILTIEAKLPIFVLREFDRHRSVDIDNTVIDTQSDFRKYNSRNEFSGRYAEMPNEFYVPSLTRIVKQSTTNKQGSGESIELEYQEMFKDHVEASSKSARLAYEQSIKDLGIAREIARITLPLNQYTKIRVTANFTNWAKFLKLRLDTAAQWEIRQYAEAVASIIQKLWPKTYTVFETHSIYSSSITSTEKTLIANTLRSCDQETWKEFLTECETNLGKVGAKQLYAKLGLTV